MSVEMEVKFAVKVETQVTPDWFRCENRVCDKSRLDR